MNKREKIEDKFEKMMDDIDYKSYHIICNYIDLTVGEALVNQKQSILKAIMKNTPKLDREKYDNLSLRFIKMIRNQTIKEFESVIKEVLLNKEKIK